MSGFHQIMTMNTFMQGMYILRTLCLDPALVEYRKDTEPLYHTFMYSLLSAIYPLPAMHSLLVTSDVGNI